MRTNITVIENENKRAKVTEIYKLYSKIMLYVAQSILNDNQMAEDAVSEAFIKIIENYKKINIVNSCKTKGFVVTIVRNVAFDMLRKKKNIHTIPLSDFSDILGYEEMDFDKLAIKEECNVIFDCISRLNTGYSEVLNLRIHYNYSNEEVSKILGISEENARMRLSRARKALKDELIKKEMGFLKRLR